MVMARDMEYPDLLGELAGNRVLLWTCNTCARYCSLGGREAAERLAGHLLDDGVDVEGVVSSAACCFMGNAQAMAEGHDEDVVLALCCDVGARNAAIATGTEVLNPVVTFGPGYLDDSGSPVKALFADEGPVSEVPLSALIEEYGCYAGPFL